MLVTELHFEWNLETALAEWVLNYVGIVWLLAIKNFTTEIG